MSRFSPIKYQFVNLDISNYFAQKLCCISYSFKDPNGEQKKLDTLYSICLYRQENSKNEDLETSAKHVAALVCGEESLTWKVLSVGETVEEAA